MAYHLAIIPLHLRLLLAAVLQTPGPLTMDDYFGLYIAMEKAERGKNRINVSKLNPNEDITGQLVAVCWEAMQDCGRSVVGNSLPVSPCIAH